MTVQRISMERALDLHVALQIGLSPKSVRRRRALALEFMVGSCVGMGLWIAYLAISLPVSYHARQWKAAWVGFDILLLAVLAGLGYCGWRRRQALIPLCLMAATLLICDAWFDIMLDLGTDDVWLSIASAFLLELPLAVFFLTRVHWLASMSLRLAWQRLELEGDPPPLRRLPLFFATGLDEAALALRAEEALDALLQQEAAARETAADGGGGSGGEVASETPIPTLEAAEMLEFFDALAAGGDPRSVQARRLAGVLRARIAAR
jgi:hypothetical protein